MKTNVTINRFCMLLIVTMLLEACQKETPNQPENDDPNGGPSAPRANLIYEEDFEGATPFATAHSIEVGDWDYAMNFVTAPKAFEGAKSVRFEIREEQELVKTG